jgi:hypothetical protein
LGSIIVLDEDREGYELILHNLSCEVVVEWFIIRRKGLVERFGLVIGAIIIQLICNHYILAVQIDCHHLKEDIQFVIRV